MPEFLLHLSLPETLDILQVLGQQRKCEVGETLQGRGGQGGAPEEVALEAGGHGGKGLHGRTLHPSGVSPSVEVETPQSHSCI